MQKCWCQHNSRSVSRDLYIFWIFFREGITVPSSIMSGYVCQVLGRGAFCPHHCYNKIDKSLWKLKKKKTELFASFLQCHSHNVCTFPATLIYIWGTKTEKEWFQKRITSTLQFSSNINEVIRSVLNFFFFFTTRFHNYKKAQKELKSIKNTTNLRFISLKFIDTRLISLKVIKIRFMNLTFIDIRFINLRFIKLKKHLNGKK